MDNNVIIKKINDWLECYQNKDNGFYNATALLKQYNEHYPNEQKLMKDFLRNKNTQNYIGSVLNDTKSPMEKSLYGNNQQVTKRYSQVTDNQIYGELSINLKINELEKPLYPFKKGVKSKNTQVSDNQVWDNSPIPNNQQVTEISDTLLYMKKGRTLKNGTQIPNTYYFAPMLFSKFGTWLSPELERDIHKVLWNNVLEYRNSLRTMNPRFTDSVKVLTDNNAIDYIKVFGMINKAVFGRHIKGINQRDTATEIELQMMMDIENEIIVLTKHNVIKNYDDLKNHIRNYYK